MKRVLPCLFCLLLLSCLEKGETTGGFVAVLNPNPGPEETGSQPGGSTTTGGTVFSSGPIVTGGSGAVAPAGATKEPDSDGRRLDEELLGPADPAGGGTFSEPGPGPVPVPTPQPLQDNPPMAGPGQDNAPVDGGLKQCEEGDRECENTIMAMLLIDQDHLCLAAADKGSFFQPGVNVTGVRTRGVVVAAGQPVDVVVWHRRQSGEARTAVDTALFIDKPDLDRERLGHQIAANPDGSVDFLFGVSPTAATGLYRIDLHGGKGDAYGGVFVEDCAPQMIFLGPPAEGSAGGGQTTIYEKDETTGVELRRLTPDNWWLEGLSNLNDSQRKKKKKFRLIPRK